MMQIIPGSGYKTVILTADDFSDFFALKDKLAALPADGTRSFLVNLSLLDTVDSRGLGLLLQLHKEALKRGGKMALFGLKPEVRRLLAMCRLDNAFAVADDEAAARKLLQA